MEGGKKRKTRGREPGRGEEGKERMIEIDKRHNCSFQRFTK